jgi:biotin-dependent carboxylase-like uncharacterized protein
MKLSEGIIQIRKPGPYCSLQDRGRWGFADKGIPVSGCMDIASAKLANFLLEQKKSLPCLEMYMGGVEFIVEAGSCQVCFIGASAEIKINDKVFKPGMLVGLQQGDRVEIPPFSTGQWLYMALRGRYTSPEILGSHSFFYPLTDKAKFDPGDRVSFGSDKFLPPTNSYVGNRLFQDPDQIKVYPGPDFEKLGKSQKKRLLSGSYTVSRQQSRMGILLEEKLENKLEDPLSSPVFPGTVQLTPGGKLIVMMRDAQVTGGYPRILQIDEVDIGKLAQNRPGEKFSFHLTSIEC